MTYGELFEAVKDKLGEAGCETPGFDAGCLLEDIGGLPHGEHMRYNGETVPAEINSMITEAVVERINGRPLQYILGDWGFLALSLKVGEGVLIPRPETELLCQAGAEYLAERGLPAPLALDLCAGSGCVGLGLCSLYPSVKVKALELQEEAFSYLKENVARYPDYSVEAIQADVLTSARVFDERFDLILSNPPYIPSGDMDGLMEEVKREPKMALDGGQDGLSYYRVIVSEWLPKLTVGGMAAVEVGIGQAQQVAEMFQKAGLREVKVIPDFGGIERVVTGVRSF